MPKGCAKTGASPPLAPRPPHSLPPPLSPGPPPCAAHPLRLVVRVPKAPAPVAKVAGDDKQVGGVGQVGRQQPAVRGLCRGPSQRLRARRDGQRKGGMRVAGSRSQACPLRASSSLFMLRPAGHNSTAHQSFQQGLCSWPRPPGCSGSLLRCAACALQARPRRQRPPASPETAPTTMGTRLKGWPRITCTM